MKSQTAESGHDQELGRKADSDSDMQGQPLHHENQVHERASSSTTATMDDSAPPPPPPSAAPQIRSRITVVCAECKRLKLKCDRRTPCGSCTKRDTVSRCIYSPAAAEKVDLHSINNRLIQVETLLSMITAGKTPPPFQSSYPLAQVSMASSHSATARPSHVASNTISPISIRMHDLVNIWMAHCQLDVFTPGNQVPLKAQDGPPVKLEQSPVELLHLSDTFHEDTILIDEGLSTNHTRTTRRSLPPLHLYHPQNPEESPYLSQDAYASEYTASQVEATSAPSWGQPSATPAIFAHLPPTAVRTRLLAHARSAIPHLPLLIHWTRVTDLADPAVVARADKERQRSLANTVFFGAHAGSRSPSPSPLSSPNPAANLPLFACMCYLLALGALESTGDLSIDHSFLYALAGQAMGVWEEFRSFPDAKEEESNLDNVDDSVDASKAKQAEKEKDDLDHAVGLLLQVKYLLRAGTSTSFKDLSETVFPLIGKLVNTARGLGLAHDPESETGMRRNARAEERRRIIWWDIMFYDIFTSDVLEQPPLITLYSYNTKLPTIAHSSSHTSNSRKQPEENANPGEESDLSCEHGDEDERRPLSAKVNTPSKGSIPPRLIPPPKTKPKTKVTSSIPEDAEFDYFGVRCRLTRLVQTLKHRLTHPGCDCCTCGTGYTLDQAAKLEAEVRSWATDLPSSLRLEPSLYPEPKTPKHTAIAAELAVFANRMIISVYVPLMRPLQDGAASSSTSVYSPAHPWSPASRATVDAAQAVIRAARVLHRLVRAGNGQSFLCGFYPLQKAVADSLVICAHSGFASTKPGRTVVLVEEVSVALQLIGTIGTPEGEISRLLASMKRRIESGDVCRKGEENTLKRKHAALEASQPVVDLDSSCVKDLSTQSQQPQTHRPVIPPAPPRQSSVPRSGKASDRKHLKKSYSSYPAVGYRDRGKDSAPWMMRKINGTKTEGEGSLPDPLVGDFTLSPVKEMPTNFQSPIQQPSPAQRPISQPNMSNGYQSRSSSVSPASRFQNGEYPPQYTEEQDIDMHPSQRRKFSLNDAGQPEETPQSFVGSSCTPYIPNQSSSHTGSYEASRNFDRPRRSFDQGSTSSDGTYGGSPSPYANSSSGPLSAASSPYGSATGHPQTPTTYTPNLHHPSPPAFVQQPSPQTFYRMSSGYDVPYEGQTTQQPQTLGASTMDSAIPVQSQVSTANADTMVTHLPHTPIYEKTQQQIMYDVKTPVELVQQQQIHHYQVSNGRGTPVDHVPMNVSTSQIWATTPQYLQPQQSLVEQQDSHYWSTSQTYY